MTKSEQVEFYQHYTDRLAALIEGPEGYDLGEDKRDEAIIALVKSLPEEPWRGNHGVLGFRCEFDRVVFDRNAMLDIFTKGDPEDLYEDVLKVGAERQWENRNDEALSLLDRANMLEYYAKDLNSDAIRKAKQFYAEGVPIAKAIGLQTSDHKLSILVEDPTRAHALKRHCVDSTIYNRDDYLTIDVRLRQDRAEQAWIDLYGNREELIAMIDEVLEADIPVDISFDRLVKTKESVPGYIDGDSYHSREVNRRSVSEKVQRNFEQAFG